MLKSIKKNELKLYILSILSLFLFFFLAFLANPAGRAKMLAEDSIVENLTMFFYFAAFIIGLRLWYSGKAGLFLPLLSLLFGLEEFAYGERLFGYLPSNITDIQLNVLHNIPELIPYHVKFFVIAFIVACAVLLLLICLKWLTLQKAVSFVKPLFATPYFTLFLILLIIAETIDFFGKVPLLPLFFEETFELLASVSLLFAVRNTSK